MKKYIRSLAAAAFYCLPVSFGWSAPLSELTRLPSGDFRLDSGGTYPLHPENEEQRIIIRTDINASVKGFSVALNSESAPLHMQFYDSTDISELIVDLSDMADLTPLTLQKTEFNDPQHGTPSEQIKISTQFKGLIHELVILGESGALPDLKLTRHLSTPHSESDIVIPVRQWLASQPLQKRALARYSADSLSRESRSEMDDSSQNDDSLIIGLSALAAFVIYLGIAEFMWIVGNTKLVGDKCCDAKFAMFARISSYIIGFGIPFVQMIIIRAVYFKVKHKFLETHFILGCCG